VSFHSGQERPSGWGVVCPFFRIFALKAARPLSAKRNQSITLAN